jgi:hypothetical protein
VLFREKLNHAYSPEGKSYVQVILERKPPITPSVGKALGPGMEKVRKFEGVV